MCVCLLLAYSMCQSYALSGASVFLSATGILHVSIIYTSGASVCLSATGILHVSIVCTVGGQCLSVCYWHTPCVNRIHCRGPVSVCLLLAYSTCQSYALSGASVFLSATGILHVSIIYTSGASVCLSATGILHMSIVCTVGGQCLSVCYWHTPCVNRIHCRGPVSVCLLLAYSTCQSYALSGASVFLSATGILHVSIVYTVRGQCLPAAGILHVSIMYTSGASVCLSATGMLHMSIVYTVGGQCLPAAGILHVSIVYTSGASVCLSATDILHVSIVCTVGGQCLYVCYWHTPCVNHIHFWASVCLSAAGMLHMSIVCTVMGQCLSVCCLSWLVFYFMVLFSGPESSDCSVWQVVRILFNSFSHFVIY